MREHVRPRLGEGVRRVHRVGEVRAAFGLDRLCTILGGGGSIRQYIAFPKNNQGRDVMINSPSVITAEQLAELSIDTTVKDEGDAGGAAAEEGGAAEGSSGSATRFLVAGALPGEGATLRHALIAEARGFGYALLLTTSAPCASVPSGRPAWTCGSSVAMKMKTANDTMPLAILRPSSRPASTLKE